MNALKKSSRSGSNEGAFTQIRYKVNRKDALRGYRSSTLWEGKSQSMHQEFKCDHYKTDKTGRKNSQDILYPADKSLLRNQFGELQGCRLSGYAQFCINQQKQGKKITFSRGLKQAMAQKLKTIHLAFIDTCRIRPNTKSKK